MIYLTPVKLINYVKDYDYEINMSESKKILEILEGLGMYISEDIVMTTDYIVNGKESGYAHHFE